MCFEADPAAAMFLLGRSEQRNYLIGLSATLYEPVNIATLQAALKRTAAVYPYFFVRFVCVQNRLLAEPAEHIPELTEKKDIYCLKPWEGQESCEARGTYSFKTICLEFSHAVSDAKGGMEFLKRLIAEYLSLLYRDNRILQGVPAIPKSSQLENGYRKYAKGFRAKKSRGSAFRIKGVQAPAKLISYCLSVREVKQAARRYGAGVTALISALLCLAVNAIQEESVPENGMKKIRLLLPLNLRTRFDCDTMRNFTSNASLEAAPEETGDIARLCVQFHQIIQAAAEPERLAGQCASAAKIYELKIMKILPVSIKKWLVQTVLALPVTGNSLTFSNLGAVFLPEELKAHIAGLSMAFSTKPESPYSCSAISIGDKLCLSFLRTIKEPVLETQFEKILRCQGLRFEIYRHA